MVLQRGDGLGDPCRDIRIGVVLMFLELGNIGAMVLDHLRDVGLVERCARQRAQLIGGGLLRLGGLGRQGQLFL